MKLFDTHAHLYLNEFNEDLDKIIQKAFDRGVNRILLPNIDIKSIESMLSVCQKYSELCLPAIALHPTSIEEDFIKDIKIIEDYLERNNNFISKGDERKKTGYFYAIGETGIDLYWDKTKFEQQKISFMLHIGLAKKYKLPIIIHSRNSLKEIFQILITESEINFTKNELRGIFHCFPGNTEDAHKIIGLGFKIGIGGVVTYKNSIMQEVVRDIDIKHIVIETDSPYLSPEPFRGKRNESSFIYHIASKIAMIKNITIEEVAATTTATAKELFGL